MKIRNGFVSNSSSSSFIIGVPQGSTDEQIYAIVEKRIGIIDTCFIEGLKKDIVGTIVECKGEKQDIQERIDENKKYIKEGYGKQEWVDYWENLLAKNLDVYDGGFSDNGDGHIQYFLSFIEFKVDEENLFMENIRN